MDTLKPATRKALDRLRSLFSSKATPSVTASGKSRTDKSFDTSSEIAASEEILPQLAKMHALQDMVAVERAKAESAGDSETLGAIDRAVPSAVMVNGLELVVLFRFEAACLLEDLEVSSGQRKAFYARLLALSMLETCNTLRQVLGRSFQHEVTLKLGAQALPDIQCAHKAICKLSRQLERAFGEVRNQLAAHRSPEASTRAQAMKSVDVAEVRRLAKEVIGALQPVGAKAVDYLIACQIRMLGMALQLDTLVKWDGHGDLAEYLRRSLPRSSP